MLISAKEIKGNQVIATYSMDELDKSIIEKAAEGFTVKEIAYKLTKSPHTVSIRIREMKKWYDCKSLAQLIGKLRQ